MKTLSRFGYPLLALALLAGLWGLLRWFDRSQGNQNALEQFAEVAALLAPDTQAVIHVPDLPAARDGFATAQFTSLGLHIGLKHIVTQVAHEFPEISPWRSWIRQSAALELSHLTLAITPGDAKTREILFLFRARQPDDGEALWHSFTERYQSHHKEVVFQKHEEERSGVLISRLSSGQDYFLAHGAWNDWHWITNRPGAIEKTLNRAQRSISSPSPTPSDQTPTSPPPTLRDHPLTRETLSTLSGGYLALAFIRSETSSTSTPPSASTSTPSAPEVPPVALNSQKLARHLERLRARSLGLSLTVRNGLMAEELMLISRDPLVPNDLPGKVRYPIRSTLRLTSPQTLAYVTGQLAAARIREAIFSDFVKRWQASPSLRLKAIARDWEASFLPIWSLQLEPADTLQAASPVSRADAEPEGLAAFLSFPLHQPNRFKEDLGILATSAGSGVQRSSSDTYRLSHVLLPREISHLFEEIHLQIADDLLILSDHLPGLRQIAQKPSRGETLRKRADFRALQRRLPKPDQGLAFLDTQALLARWKEALRHPLVFATLWMGIRSQTELDIDLKAFARALRTETPVVPTLAAWKSTARGIHVESLGTLSPTQWALGGGAVLTSLNNTFLDSQPGAGNEDEAFALPPIEEELLQLMEPD